MWIKTQQGELDFDRSVTLGKFNSRAEAVAFFNLLANLLSKETDHD